MNIKIFLTLFCAFYNLTSNSMHIFSREEQLTYQFYRAGYQFLNDQYKDIYNAKNENPVNILKKNNASFSIMLFNSPIDKRLSLHNEDPEIIGLVESAVKITMCIESDVCLQTLQKLIKDQPKKYGKTFDAYKKILTSILSDPQQAAQETILLALSKKKALKYINTQDTHEKKVLFQKIVFYKNQNPKVWSKIYKKLKDDYLLKNIMLQVQEYESYNP